MFKPCLLVYVEESSLEVEIQNVLADKKIEIYFATRGDQLSQLVKTYIPFLMVADLSGREPGWIFKHISIIKHAKYDFPICVIINNDEESIRSRAEKYGCDKIILKSEFIKKLPNVVERVLRKSL